MLDQLQLHHVLFLDIETVPQVYHFDDLPDEAAALFEQKERFRIERDNKEARQHYTDRAGILSEFGKIVCISCGYFANSAGGPEFRVKSFAGADEGKILSDFFRMVEGHFGSYKICGHNIKEFDVPYLCRRGVIHGLSLPPSLQLYGMKPWEVPLIDTMDLWRFGDFKNYTSLSLLAYVLGIPTPKDDIDGSQVARVFWEDDDIGRIVTYCQKDVVTTARVVQRMKGDSFIADDAVRFV